MIGVIRMLADRAAVGRQPGRKFRMGKDVRGAAASAGGKKFILWILIS